MRAQNVKSTNAELIEARDIFETTLKHEQLMLLNYSI